MDVWTRVPKPAEASVVLMSSDAEPFGLLLAITSMFSGSTTSILTGWTDITKPSPGSWIAVAKPVNSVWTFVDKPTQ